jgi:hypothetical protein
MTNVPFVQPFNVGLTAGFAVGYTIIRGQEGIPDTVGVLEFYTKQNERWVATGIPESDFRGRRFFVNPMDSHRSDEKWFLVWGNRLGDTGARLNVRLYSFDGSSVRTIWERTDLSTGTIKVLENAIELEYDERYKAPVSERISKKFYITPSGLQ